jgi:hypothetical protein
MLKVHDLFRNIKCRLIYDTTACRRRFVSVEGQGLPADLFVKYDKAIRELYEINTIFLATEIKVCKNSDGKFYLRAKDHCMIPVETLKLDIHKTPKG